MALNIETDVSVTISSLTKIAKMSLNYKPYHGIECILT
jgi:hypothetical protein